MNFYPFGGSLTSSITEFLSRRGNFSIDAKLEAARIGHAEAGLVGHAMFSHAGCNGCIAA